MGQYGVLRDDYGGGVYRRRILLRGDPASVRADLEDDFHRFAVVVDHDSTRVSGVRGHAWRWPWTTCPAAAGALERLRGAELAGSPAALARLAEPATQCTHLLDLAVLAVGCAARRTRRLEYVAAVPDLADGATRATLARDGEALLAWSLRGTELVAPTPPPFAGRSLWSGFGGWTEEALAPDVAEAARVLRRAVMVALGRQFDWSRVEQPGEFGAAAGNCHSFQPAQVASARRQPDTLRDFTRSPERLLADLAELAEPPEPES